jgi:hypothetical protein
VFQDSKNVMQSGPSFKVYNITKTMNTAQNLSDQCILSVYERYVALNRRHRCNRLILLLKLKHLDEMAVARNRLIKEYGMTDNADLLYGFADALFAQYRYADCFAITSRYAEGVINCFIPL